MRSAIFMVTAFVLALCAASPSYALSDSQKQDMQTELRKIVQKRQGEMQEQKQIFESGLKHEDEDALSAHHKLDDKLKLARYWIQRRQSEGADAAELENRKKELSQLEDQKKELVAADAERRKDHKQQREDMDKKTAQQKDDLEAAQTRFTAAAFSDSSNDYDHALGVAMAAYGDPHWTPETKTQCHTANGVTDCSTTGYNK